MLMNNQSLVSIITPSYNQRQYLEETIESVLNQTYPSLEYIIVDGGSTDGSLDLIEDYSNQIDLFISEPDQGQTDAINKGFRHAQGDYLAWINSDDTYQPKAVEEAVHYLEAHPRAGMVYGDAMIIDENGHPLAKFNAQPTNYERLLRGSVNIPQPAAFWRSNLWVQVGPLDPAFYFAMDYDLWVRLAEVSELHYLPRHWANFRLHSGAKTIAADDRCWPEMKKVFLREGGGFLSPFMVKYVLRKTFAPFWQWYKRKKLGL